MFGEQSRRVRRQYDDDSDERAVTISSKSGKPRKLPINMLKVVDNTNTNNTSATSATNATNANANASTTELDSHDKEIVANANSANDGSSNNTHANIDNSNAAIQVQHNKHHENQVQHNKHNENMDMDIDLPANTNTPNIVTSNSTTTATTSNTNAATNTFASVTSTDVSMSLKEYIEMENGTYHCLDAARHGVNNLNIESESDSNSSTDSNSNTDSDLVDSNDDSNSSTADSYVSNHSENYSGCGICHYPHEDEDRLLLCGANYRHEVHTYCLVPPLMQVPPEDAKWYCPCCDPVGSTCLLVAYIQVTQQRKNEELKRMSSIFNKTSDGTTNNTANTTTSTNSSDTTDTKGNNASNHIGISPTLNLAMIACLPWSIPIPILIPMDIPMIRMMLTH